MSEERFYSGSTYLIPAKCPQCGGLFGSSKRGHIKCRYCNSEFFTPELFKAAESKVRNFYEIAFNAQEAGNFKEAYDYFTKVLENAPDEYLAWFGKGTAAGYLSSSYNVRYSEVISCFEKARNYAPEKDKKDVERTLGVTAGLIGSNILDWSREHKLASDENLGQILELLKYWDSKDPENEVCWKWLVHLGETSVSYVKKVDQFGTHYGYEYPYKNIAYEYSKKIREKFNPKFRNIWEASGCLGCTLIIPLISIVIIIIIIILSILL